MSIREVRRSGGERETETEDKEEEEGSGRKVGAGVKTQARRQDLRRRAWRQGDWRRASCHVTTMSASSLGARRHQDV